MWPQLSHASKLYRQPSTNSAESPDNSQNGQFPEWTIPIMLEVEWPNRNFEGQISKLTCNYNFWECDKYSICWLLPDCFINVGLLFNVQLLLSRTRDIRCPSWGPAFALKVCGLPDCWLINYFWCFKSSFVLLEVWEKVVAKQNENCSVILGKSRWFLTSTTYSNF